MMLVFRFEESAVSELEKLRNRLRLNEKRAQEKRERLESERKRNRLRKQGHIIPY